MTPVCPDAAAAAARIFSRLRLGSQHDSILRRAAEAFPNSDYADTLARVVLLNELYGTNVYAVTRMAHHIAALGDLANWTGEACVVETIAELPPRPGDKARHFRSFAAKYAHFFVDQARYHILDDAAVTVLARHAHVTAAAAKRWSYRTFNEHAEQLRTQSGLGADRSLDRYLWIGGMRLRALQPRTSDLINRELQGVFEAAASREDIDLIMSKLPSPVRGRRQRPS